MNYFQIWNKKENIIITRGIRNHIVHMHNETPYCLLRFPRTFKLLNEIFITTLDFRRVWNMLNEIFITTYVVFSIF